MKLFSLIFQDLIYNVLYRYFDQYHYFDSLEARFVKYDDDDSENKNIIYLLRDVSRS
jgi:hypothetical protein